ncbi:histone-like nucleoid-structuring protein Lsr2 [Streptomyces sp. SR27]|uniref:Lsr2 family DNA-binding protein n=1 Tax=Streptomyces sp. SR27 TaxID=3076630 RepID=UPI00295BA389|nr:histone-like nucleoid-structuring protein Lsr2 [Streptomyces sp. SR27]MDV9188203.1 histone-like nucleoid-structuring protein Lsr2 [Streptomyces sp. SR27]
MFTDLTVSTQAGALALTPSTTPQLAAAARTVARHAHDETDLARLLDVLGLLTADDTTDTETDPLPETGDPATMTNTTTIDAGSTRSAHEAVALSMHADGASEQAIREATGLTETELSDLIADKALALPRAAAFTTPVIDVPVVPLPGSDSLQGLIEWAAAHPAASVRKNAARITTALTELSARRESEAAQREAEARVAKARAVLEKAEQDLKAVKAGTRTTAASTAPTQIRTGTSGTYSRDELAAIRTWARAHGHPVADRGLPSKTVLDKYAAAHAATPARKAG